MEMEPFTKMNMEETKLVDLMVDTLMKPTAVRKISIAELMEMELFTRMSMPLIKL